ncbi:putative dipeptide-transport integral membrane protein ABC transporter DppB [Sphaerisporangium krabiense]|uniref:Peptide/nickel transport system permease protein/oligopeptide transport system permease protein n=1 Tax=Sphaerisporangium krabiense TaxID=763782 RepID=A0A7W8Z408_9ACTN|nr:ABC transporter permease [Sphaerisporangium krabiense]MBB5627005.1 peptide/nickel transport system permease protein/oligopeptide transport system permease protein [Sphaerisporangium krabiense]GII65157.1 putative dipeptide-transport integral membrane protein ABC transporter DppB [Sphaerisporangium krabiense]
MGRYVLRRLLQAIPVLLGTTFLIFAIVYALPGDPLQALAGEKRVDPVFAAAMREQFHLNEPLVVRYGYYVRDIVSGNFGTTFRGLPVSTIFEGKFQVTFKLAMTALIFEAIIGVGLGLWAALRRGKWEDKAVLAFTLLLVSIPTLVSGFVLQLVLGVKFKQSTGLALFPVAGIGDGLRSYLLPGFVLATVSVAYLTRLTRTSLMETLRADYVRTAIAKGMPRRRVLGRHALRNSLIPMVTYLGADLGTLMGGAVITETIFNLPGIGQQLFQSVYLRENPVVVGIVTVLVLIYIVANLVVDLLYAVLDPRIRYE